jgi:Ca-activated chloride channel homolog
MTSKALRGVGAPRRWLLVSALAVCALAQALASSSTPLSVRITSPLGRTGTEGAIRIVAQIEHPPGTPLLPVRFFVDNVLLGEDSDGPPYAIEWTDENPFELREIRVEVSDATGNSARDAVLLRPLEIIERSEVSSVLLEATVQDAQARFVTGLAADAFTLTENDELQQIDIVRPETMPATFTLLIDSSQSMSRRIDFVQDAAASLTRHLRPQDQVIVVPFKRGIGAITGPTNDRATVVEAIRDIHAQGGTAILDSLEQTAQVLGAVEGRHAIVLVTDGYDEHSTRPYEDTIRTVQATGASVYVVGIGGVAGISLRGERFLKELATRTGGRAFFPSREIELQPIHQLVAADVQRRYLVTYTPVNQKVDGTWRAIALSTSHPEWTVRTRPGYFAPAPPPVRASLEFTVVDSERRLLNLSAEDLEVVEDGVEQAIDGFKESTLPVSIMFALDTSGSMRKVVEEVKAAARSFVTALRPEDSLGMILFADRAAFAHDLTRNRSWSLQAIDDYKAVGGTALYDAIYNSLMRLRGIEGRRVVVVMTDGRDEDNPGTAPGSVHTFTQVLERLRSVDATVYAVALGTQIDAAPLKQLARESGGDAYFPQDVSELEDEFRRIVETLRQRYVVSYTSTNSSRDGQWRDVEIRSRISNVEVKSRGGYFEPSR